MKQIKPISTSIKQIVKNNELLIIREDSSNFDGTSNVYCHNGNEILWYAELTSPEDFYTNDLIIFEDNLFSFTWEGYKVHIDVSTGKIISKELAK